MNFKDYLNESSLSRVWKQANEHDTGTLSAFRYAPDCGNGKPYTKSENKSRNAKMKAKLLKYGYGVTKIDSTYIENYGSENAIEVKEESFLVVDIKDSGNLKRDLMKLGEEFDQDSITYSNPSSKYYLIGTNKCPDSYPGYQKEEKLGTPLFGKDGELHSKINGRPFVFEVILSEMQVLSDLSISEIRSTTKLAED